MEVEGLLLRGEIFEVLGYVPYVGAGDTRVSHLAWLRLAALVGVLVREAELGVDKNRPIFPMNPRGDGVLVLSEMSAIPD